MRRRALLGSLAGLAVAGPAIARAQADKRPLRIGYLAPGSRRTEDDDAFFAELARLGYVEGRNLAVDFAGYGEHPGRLPALAAGFAHAPVDLIVAAGAENAVRAARAATGSIPIVVVAINYDPVERGYAAGFGHPGGNVTGVFFRSLELVDKQVELLKAMVPKAARLTVIWGAETADEFAAARRSAAVQGLALSSFKLGEPPYNFDAIFAAVAKDSPPIVLVLSTPAFATRHVEAAAAALHYRLPTMWRYGPYVEAGGLMSYGVDSPAMRRLAARYVAKILGGARPTDLPIQRADKFELVINMKTATALRLTVPPLLIARADEVIQ